MNVNNLGIGFSEVINSEKKSRHYFEICKFVVSVPGSTKICVLNFLGKEKSKTRLLIESQCQTPYHKAGFSEDRVLPCYVERMIGKMASQDTN